MAVNHGSADRRGKEPVVKRPFTRTGGLVALIAILIAASVGSCSGQAEPGTGTTMTGEQDASTARGTDPNESTSAEATGGRSVPTTSGAEASGSTSSTSISVCGLPDGETRRIDGDIKAPEAEWKHQGQYSYPVSSLYGPGKASVAGVRYCFQRSPEGALFAAANAVSQGSTRETSMAFAEYFLAKGETREAALKQMREERSRSSASSSSNSYALSISGFKMRSYDGDRARVEVAMDYKGTISTSHARAIYDLVWEDGDWKWDAGSGYNPAQVTQISSLTGYTLWGA